MTTYGGPPERTESAGEAAAATGPDQPAADIAKSTVDAVSSQATPYGFGTERHGMFGVRGSGDTTGFGGLVREPYDPPNAERPYGSYFDELVDNLAAAYPGLAEAVEKTVVDRGELTLYLRREHLRGVCAALRNSDTLRFELCSSVSGADYYGQERRLHAVYHLTSMTYRRRIRLEVAVGLDDPHIPSVVDLYPTADWQEREAFDLFGIVFDGHPALTRVMMPDDWDGHPQRKDYPLGGVPVEYKGATIPPPDERRAYV